MKIIYIVDDNATNLVTAKNALDGKYETYALPSAARMFKLLERITPDLILLDVDMPETDGFEALTALKSDGRLKDIPVIFLTAKNDTDSEIRGFEIGAIDFINKPFSPPVLIKRIELHIETDKLIKQSIENVRKVYNATIKNIAEMVDNRDKTTGAHVGRTQKYLKILVNHLLSSGTYAEEVSRWDLDIVFPSAQLHDVGKITVSDLVLNKPGKLTDEEFEQIKQHCIEGERIIDNIIRDTEEDTFLLHAKRFAGYHHEKWDGSGYPRGLQGAAIPLEARIMAIADVYDALVSARPYKNSLTHEQAVDIIKNSSGTHFDPALVGIFLDAEESFRKD